MAHPHARRPSRRPAACPVLVALALIASAPTAPARAEPEPFRIAGTRDGYLAIREAPDAGAAEIARVPLGARVLGFGCTGDTPSGHTWCRVKSGRSVGWARRRYLSPE